MSKLKNIAIILLSLVILVGSNYSTYYYTKSFTIVPKPDVISTTIVDNKKQPKVVRIHKTKAYPCTQISYYVSKYGEQAVRQAAKNRGMSNQEIDKNFQRCLKS